MFRLWMFIAIFLLMGMDAVPDPSAVPTPNRYSGRDFTRTGNRIGPEHEPDVSPTSTVTPLSTPISVPNPAYPADSQPVQTIQTSP
jgi:hypothetical protein